MADNQVPIFVTLAREIIPEARERVPEQQETSRQEDLIRSPLLQKYRPGLQNPQISNRIKIHR